MLPDTFTAQTHEQARLLHDSRYSRLLAALVRDEASAAELAQTAKVDVKQAHHRLTRLLGAGLVRVTGQRQRGGRPVKLYRAAAKAFEVPFHLSDAATFAELLAELQRPHLEKHYQVVGEVVMRHSSGTFRYTVNEQGELSGTVSDFVNDDTPGGTVAMSLYARYRLTDSQAREAERRLSELNAWLEEQALGNGQEGETYTLGLLLSPEK